METVKLIIDRKPVEVPKGTTILDAAKGMGIRIPTLCYMKLEDLHYENNPGACRICVVEIEGRRNLAPSCKTECMEGMVVQTHSPRVMNARKTVMELILSNHPAECLTCSSNGHCELQAIAHDLGIREIRYKGEMSTFQIDRSPSIVRNMNKCIMCRRCETMCNNIQTVGALTAVNRGFNAAVSTAFERDIAGSTCSYCGQCVSVCPVNALSGRNTQQPVLDALADPDKIVIAQTAPAVRTALGRDFGYEPGTLVTGKMVSALRRFVRKATMPNINGIITFRATISIARKPKYFLGIKIHRAIIQISWELTSAYTDTHVTDVLTLDPNLPNEEKTKIVNNRISEIAREYPNCKITTEYARTEPMEEVPNSDVYHLLWSSDRLEIAREVDSRITKIYADLVSLEKMMHYKRNIIDVLKDVLPGLDTDEGRRLTLVEECHDRWVENARTSRSGRKEVRP